MRWLAWVCRLTGDHRWRYYGHDTAPCDCTRCGTKREGCWMPRKPNENGCYYCADNTCGICLGYPYP